MKTIYKIKKLLQRYIDICDEDIRRSLSLSLIDVYLSCNYLDEISGWID